LHFPHQLLFNTLLSYYEQVNQANKNVQPTLGMDLFCI